MFNRALALIGLAFLATPAVAQPAFHDHSGVCTSLALPFSRSMLVCNGVPSAQAVSLSLRSGVTHRTNPKVIGTHYRLPPSEITGIQSAGYDSRSQYQAPAQLIEIDRRTFAVYLRSGTTILIERRR